MPLASDPFGHLMPSLTAGEIERHKAAFAARMAESAKHWPGGRSRRKPRR
jgi:hypothetical protein